MTDPETTQQVSADYPVAMQGQLLAVEQERTTADDYYTPADVFEALGLQFQSPSLHHLRD